MEYTNQQVLTYDVEDHGQTIKNISEMKIRGQKNEQDIFGIFNIWK